MRRILYLVILLAVAMMSLAGCTSDGPDVVAVTGEVRYIDLEGGFYGIVGDNGENYDPINLSTNFQKHGLNVYFEARIHEDIASTHMWGTTVEIITIREPSG